MTKMRPFAFGILSDAQTYQFWFLDTEGWYLQRDSIGIF